MEIVKGILIAIYLIIALIVIILTLIQTKEDAGLSSTITGSSTNNFFEKNKGKTKEGKQKKWTIILSIVFAILTIVTYFLYFAQVLWYNEYSISQYKAIICWRTLKDETPCFFPCNPHPFCYFLAFLQLFCKKHCYCRAISKRSRRC